MGAIDGIPKNESVYGQEVRSQLSPAPDLVDGFSRLGVDDSSLKDGRSLIQVMKAVEAAEYIIKHQVGVFIVVLVVSASGVALLCPGFLFLSAWSVLRNKSHDLRARKLF